MDCEKPFRKKFKIILNSIIAMLYIFLSANIMLVIVWLNITIYLT